MFFCFSNFSATYKLENFLPLIFLEIAIYGSFILYEISKKINNYVNQSLILNQTFLIILHFLLFFYLYDVK